MHRRSSTHDVEASEANSLTASYLEDALPFMAERGAVIEGPDGAWHPTLRSAWRMTRAWFKVQPNLAKPYHSSCTTGPHQGACFTRIYEQIEAVDAVTPPRADVRAGLVILSLRSRCLGEAIRFGFAAPCGCTSDSRSWPCDSNARVRLSRHEHFFHPFLWRGLARSAKEMPVWKQAIVLLAGPVPGLFAAAAFLLYRGFYPFETSIDVSKIAVVVGFVNLANLLPLSPLDGGKLLEISVFSRWPRAHFAMAVLSVIAFSALAIWLQDLFALLFFCRS